ncbi:MAG: hypothetical protein A2Y73_04965, partial [Chloroflexi bacterium RBG_13_56_8]
MDRFSARRWEWIALAIIMLVAVGLRLYRLDAQSLWNDEGTSVALAQRDLATIARNAAQDIHPPLYYYLLHYWLAAFGSGEWAVRFFSALGGTALVLATYFLARRIFSSLIASLAAVFSALSPFQVYYSQEARMYIFASLFGLLSMLAFVHWLDCHAEEIPGKVPWLSTVAYVVASILAIYSHYFAFTVILGQNIAFLVWLIYRHRGEPRPWPRTRHLAIRWSLMQAIVLVAYVPWLMVSWHSLQRWPAVSEPFTLPGLLQNIAQVFALGYPPRTGIEANVAGIAYLFLIVFGILQGIRERHVDVMRRNLLTTFYLLVPIATMFVLSLQRPMYKPKFLLLATPAYYILLANGCLALGGWAKRILKMRWMQLTITVILALAICAASAWSLYRLYFDEDLYRDDYRGIVAYIEATAGPDDAILINAPAQIETVDYYYDGPLAEYPLPRQRPMDRGDTEAQLEEIFASHRRIYAILWATGDSDPEGFVETWLDQHCFKALDSWYGNVRLAIYSVPQASSGEIAHPLDYRLGDDILLRGYSLLTQEPHSGDILELSLFWEATGTLSRRYKVFVHLVDGRGNIVGQQDGEPCGGACPTD